MRPRSIAIAACAFAAAVLLAALYLVNVEESVPTSDRRADSSVPRGQEGLPIGSFRHAATKSGEPDEPGSVVPTSQSTTRTCEPSPGWLVPR